MTIRAMTTKIVALLGVAALGAFASSALAELVCGEAVSDGSSASRGGSWSRAVYEDETRSSDVERDQTTPQIKEAGCRRRDAPNDAFSTQQEPFDAKIP